MHWFWRKGRKIHLAERFKTSAIFNARFRESYFKLKVNGRAVTSQTDKQPNVEVGSVWVCIGQPTCINFQFESPGMKLLFSTWAFVYFPLLFHLSRALLAAWRFGLFRCFHNRLYLIREPAFYWVLNLFSQFSLICFIICNNEKGLFVLVQQTSDFVALG